MLTGNSTGSSNACDNSAVLACTEVQDSTARKETMKTKSRTLYLMVIPGTALLFLFHTLPALQGVFYSMTDSRGFGPWKFIGVDNYVRLFADHRVYQSYLFTIGFAIAATLTTNIISLILAIGLSKKVWFRSFLRSVFFLPAVLSVLVVGFIFNYLFANAGPQMGEALGISALSANILGNPDLAWLGIVIVASWQACAVTTVLYLAGIQNLPEDVMEAAEIDGARPWKLFWLITFPLIAPFFSINMVLSMKNFLMVFDQIVALTGGGPGTSTQSISFMIYKNGFSGSEFAYQSANAVVYLVVIALISIVQLRYLRSREVSA